MLEKQPRNTESTANIGAEANTLDSPSVVGVRFRSRPWLIHSGLVFASVVAFLVVFEVGYRALSMLVPSHPFRDLPQEYYLAEGADNDRDYVYATTKPENTYRMFVVGDSFTFGGTMQFFDAFPKRLERMLNLNLKQPRVEVVNYSITGMATVHEVGLVRHILKYYQPDFILLQITLNDPEPKPYRASHSYQAKDGQIVLERGIFAYWKSLRFVVERLLIAKSHWEQTDYYFGIFANKKNWTAFRSSLEVMRKRSVEKGVKFGAVIFPLFDYRIDDAYPFRELHEQLHRALDAALVPYLDLTNAYQNIPPDRLQAVPGVNTHPSELANRIAAEELYRWMGQQELVPKEAFARRVKLNRRARKRPTLNAKDNSWSD